METQLDEAEGRACIGGGEDNPTGVVQHRYVRCQYHLPAGEKWIRDAGLRVRSIAWTLNPELALTYGAPGTNANPELLFDEGVVDPLGNVMEGLSVIRTGDKRRRRGFASYLPFCPVTNQRLTHLL